MTEVISMPHSEAWPLTSTPLPQEPKTQRRRHGSVKPVLRRIKSSLFSHSAQRSPQDSTQADEETLIDEKVGVAYAVPMTKTQEPPKRLQKPRPTPQGPRPQPYSQKSYTKTEEDSPSRTAMAVSSFRRSLSRNRPQTAAPTSHVQNDTKDARPPSRRPSSGVYVPQHAAADMARTSAPQAPTTYQPTSGHASRKASLGVNPVFSVRQSVYVDATDGIHAIPMKPSGYDETQLDLAIIDQKLMAQIVLERKAEAEIETAARQERRRSSVAYRGSPPPDSLSTPQSPVTFYTPPEFPETTPTSPATTATTATEVDTEEEFKEMTDYEVYVLRTKAEAETREANAYRLLNNCQQIGKQNTTTTSIPAAAQTTHSQPRGRSRSIASRIGQYIRPSQTTSNPNTTQPPENIDTEQEERGRSHRARSKSRARSVARSIREYIQPRQQNNTYNQDRNREPTDSGCTHNPPRISLSFPAGISAAEYLNGPANNTEDNGRRSRRNSGVGRSLFGRRGSEDSDAEVKIGAGTSAGMGSGMGTWPRVRPERKRERVMPLSSGIERFNSEIDRRFGL